jgi:hypothetical protein
MSYSGNWDGNFFQYGGQLIADDSNLTLGANIYQLSYDSGSVTLTVVPEPGTPIALIGGAMMLLGLHRRRS